MPQAVLNNTLFQPKLFDESSATAGGRTLLPDGPVDFFRAAGFNDLEIVSENGRGSQLRFAAVARSAGEPVACLAEWVGAPEDEFPRNSRSGREEAIGVALRRNLPWLLLLSRQKLEIFHTGATDPESTYLSLDRKHIWRVIRRLGSHQAESGGPWELGLLPAARPVAPSQLETVACGSDASRILVAGDFPAQEIRPLFARLRKESLRESRELLFVIERREFPDRFEEAAIPSSLIRPRDRAGLVRLLAGEPGLHAFVTELSRDPSVSRPRTLLNQQMSFLEMLFAEHLQLLGSDLTLLSIGTTASNRGAQRRLELGLGRFRDVANLWLAVRLGARVRPGAIANLIDGLDGDSDDFLERLKPVQAHIDRLLKKQPVAHVELEVPEVYVRQGRPRHDPGFDTIVIAPSGRKPVRQALVRLAGTSVRTDNPTDGDVIVALLDRHDPMLSARGSILIRAAAPGTDVVQRARELFRLELSEGPEDGWCRFSRSAGSNQSAFQ